jgi:hypothetical protein
MTGNFWIWRGWLFLWQRGGDRLADIEVNVFAMNVVVGRGGNAAAEELARRHELTPAAMGEAPEHLLGEPAAICDRLLANREELGISYVVVPAAAMDVFAPVVQELAGR